jgi:hypothetical protein
MKTPIENIKPDFDPRRMEINWSAKPCQCCAKSIPEGHTGFGWKVAETQKWVFLCPHCYEEWKHFKNHGVVPTAKAKTEPASSVDYIELMRVNAPFRLAGE